MKIKKVTALVLASVMALSLTACGGNKNETSEGGEAKESKGVIELKFPTYLAGENVGATFFLPEIERFNEKYEGKYKITVEEVPQASYADKIKQLAQQNKLPVLVHAPGSGGIDTQWFKQIVLANDMAYDLTEFAEENPDVAANWIPESREFCTVDGKLICKPTSVLKPVGLYYNSSMYTPDKDIRDMTVDEFVDSLGDNKIAFMTAENGWTTALMLTALIANEEGGVELLNSSVNDKLWDYSAPAFVNGVAKLQTILQNNASSNTVGAAYADAANAFMSKNAAVICNGSWMAPEFEEGSADKWSNGFNGEDVKATIYPGNIAFANPSSYGEFWIANTATDEEKEAAEAFLAFRDSQEEIEELVLTEGGVAPQLTYSDNFLAELKKTPLLYELSESMNDETTYCASLGDVFPAPVADTEFGKLLPKLIDNTLTPEEFCDELTKKAEEAKQ
ncbi:ABC transporter substrate-binding protein [Blautia producta]|nr:ABC transporter substrate-binding protein [Blautia producta]